MATFSDTDSNSSFHGFTSEALDNFLQHNRTLDITIDEISIDEFDGHSDEDFSSKDNIPIGQLQKKSTADVNSPTDENNNISGTTRSLVHESELTTPCTSTCSALVNASSSNHSIGQSTTQAVDTNVPIDRTPGEHIPRLTEKSRKTSPETSKWKKNMRKQ